MEWNWQNSVEKAQESAADLDHAIQALTAFRDKAVSDIAAALRMDKGIELDLDAIHATLTRPYTIIPINEHEAWLIHWRGVKMPIFGWVVAQEPAFIKAKVSRSMDLLTPLPAWMKSELGWKAPDHTAVIDGTRTGLTILSGDESSFKRRYGRHLGARQADGTFKIKSGDAWIKLVAVLVRDGILPYQPCPVASKDWDEKAKFNPSLTEVLTKLEWESKRPFLARAVRGFMDKGAVLVNYPPGAGKTLVTAMILTSFRGKVLLLADTTILIDQWRDRLKKFVPATDVTVSTYQGAGKYLDKPWDLCVFDEAQRLPANTFSKLAFIKTKYRLGLTGTPWREDDRQFLITALSGFPIAIRWGELITAGVLRRPHIIVATVPSESAKTGYVRSLLAKRRGRAIIFCDWLEQGQALADALDIPFIHGGTSSKLDRILETEVCVVSRIGDRGLSLPDLRLVIEVAGAGSAREQFAQRVGRLLHGDFEGDFYTVFTPEEAAKYRGRIFGVEAELAGEVDIDFIEVGNTSAVEHRTFRQEPTRSRTRATPAPHRVQAAPRASQPPEPPDDTTQALALPSVAAKLSQAKKSVGSRTAPYLERVLRYCWTAALSPKEIAEGLGIVDQATRSRLNSACAAAAKTGLMKVEGGRYMVDQEEINRLRTLSNLKRK